MVEALTLAEIKARFTSEWVLIQDPRTTKALDIVKGVVVWHSKDRDEVYRKARALSLKHAAIVYTGQVPDGTAVVLWHFDLTQSAV